MPLTWKNVKYKWILWLCLVVVIAFLFNECTKARTIEAAFNKKIKFNNENTSYKILHKIQQGDHGLLLFSVNDSISLGYFAEKDGIWSWVKTDNCSLKWSAVIGKNPPYMYCGLITDTMYAKIIVGGKEAKTIKLKGNRSIWYYIGYKATDVNLKIKGVRPDGKEEWLKQM